MEYYVTDRHGLCQHTLSIVDMIIPRDSPVWFTKELVDEIHHKDYLYQQEKFEGNEKSWKNFQKRKKM